MVRRSRIFSSAKVKTWNDPAIAKLNPNAKLPSQAIVVVHRSDGSGTTFLFTDYLSKVSADWKSKVGANTAVEWPVGLGAKGNEGVANNVTQTKGSIGYVEYAYAKQNKMTSLNMMNKDGKAVAPTAEAFKAAAANADWEGTAGFGVILTDQSGPTSWPLAGATFILMHKQPKDTAAAAEALKFFAWAYTQGRQDGRRSRLCPDAGQSRRARSRKYGRSRSRTRAASRSTRSRTDVMATGKGASVGSAPFHCPRHSNRMACLEGQAA